MPKFKRKPQHVEAVQYAGHGNNNPRGAVPDWMWKAYEDRRLTPTQGQDPLIANTPDGPDIVRAGDWIVLDGEDIRVFSDDDFKANYDLVEDDG